MGKIKILITGGNGYIGKSLFNALKGDYNIESVGRDYLDLTDRDQVSDFLSDNEFDVIIHTAVMGGSRLKDDPENTCYNNILMMENLLLNKNKFGRLINFSSGIEDTESQTEYALSKRITSKMVEDSGMGYNLKIYGVFDENEWDTRFIKTNIKNYINKKPIEIFKNKRMDFFYMEDLLTIVRFYIEEDGWKETNLDCCYGKKYSLTDIGNIIGGLENDKYSLNIQNSSSQSNEDYIGESCNLHGFTVDFIGLEEGIKRTYKKLLNNED